MKIFLWDDSLMLGIPIIDGQHKEFLNALRDLQIGLHSKVTYEALKEKLAEVDRYREVHFQTEETLMKPYKNQLSTYDEHMKAHRYFVQSVDDFYLRFSQEGPEMAQALFVFLGKWLCNHISTMDKQMIEELKKLGAPCFDR